MHDYFHKEIGYNYRMPNAQALLALKSLRNYKKENARRRKKEKEFYGRNYLDAVWVLPVLNETEKQRDWIIKHTKNTRYFFKPLSSFPMYGGKCQSPKAEHYSKIGTYVRI
jgi:dTDP-4-amino-4,6-dideoxygalactose transaminase